MTSSPSRKVPFKSTGTYIDGQNLLKFFSWAFLFDSVNFYPCLEERKTCGLVTQMEAEQHVQLVLISNSNNCTLQHNWVTLQTNTESVPNFSPSQTAFMFSCVSSIRLTEEEGQRRRRDTVREEDKEDKKKKTKKKKTKKKDKKMLMITLISVQPQLLCITILQV